MASERHKKTLEAPEEAPKTPPSALKAPRALQEATKRPPRGPPKDPKKPRNAHARRLPDVHPAKREESTSGRDVLPEAGRAAERKP